MLSKTSCPIKTKNPHCVRDILINQFCAGAYVEGRLPLARERGWQMVSRGRWIRWGLRCWLRQLQFNPLRSRIQLCDPEFANLSSAGGFRLGAARRYVALPARLQHGTERRQIKLRVGR